MSTDADMYAERDNVLVIQENEITAVHYDSIKVGDCYTVQLISGSFTIYRKTNLFDDTFLEKVKTRNEAVEKLFNYGKT